MLRQQRPGSGWKAETAEPVFWRLLKWDGCETKRLCTRARKGKEGRNSTDRPSTELSDQAQAGGLL